MPIELFLLREPRWGDYWHTVVAGLDSQLPDGGVVVDRTGPFTPPICFTYCSGCLVSDSFRRELESLRLDGLGFDPVAARKVVALDWNRRDLKKRDPPVIPESGEPEDIIKRRRHSKRAASSAKRQWRVTAPCCMSKSDAGWFYSAVSSRQMFEGDTEWSYADQGERGGVVKFGVMSTRSGRLIVTADVKDWLSDRVSEWVEFERITS